MGFFDELKQQRWDDHRYYHHSRINQSLHLFSACCFVAAYIMIFYTPVTAALVGWFLAMISRQVGHFFFEPKGFDYANQVTHEYKESIKVGYNLFRKIILLTVWAVSPVILHFNPSLFGLFEPHTNAQGYIYNLSLLWIYLGLAAVLFRTVQLVFESGVQTGMVWFTKILTDPLHDIRIYYKSPWYVLRGELYDPIVSHS